MISDGAAALIIADDELALEAEKAISFKARVQMNDLMPMSKRDKLNFVELHFPGRKLVGCSSKSNGPFFC